MIVLDDTAFLTLSMSMRHVTGSMGTLINRIPIKSQAWECTVEETEGKGFVRVCVRVRLEEYLLCDKGIGGFL